MMTKTEVRTLLGFYELLSRWKASGEADDLATVFAATEGAMRRGQTDTAELRARAIGAVTGTALTIGEPHAWTAHKQH